MFFFSTKQWFYFLLHSSVVLFLFFLRDSGSALGLHFPFPRATMLALHLDCATAALTTHQRFYPGEKLVDFKTLDFNDRTAIPILTSAVDKYILWLIYCEFGK